MSGFLPGIASWALGGGAGDDDEENNNEESTSSTTNDNTTPTMTEDEIRAQRLARFATTTTPTIEKDTDDNKMDVDSPSQVESKVKTTTVAVDSTDNTSMEIDDEDDEDDKKPAAKDKKDATEPPAINKINISSFSDMKKRSVSPMKNEPSVSISKNEDTNIVEKKPKTKITLTDEEKTLRKKLIILRKTLGIVLDPSPINSSVSTGSSNDSSNFIPVVKVRLDSTTTDFALNQEQVSEILFNRLTMSLEELKQSLVSQSSGGLPAIDQIQKGVIPYLGHCYKSAATQIRTLDSGRATKDSSALLDLLKETQSQVVNYAVTAFMDPTMFPPLGALGCEEQLADCLIMSVTNIDASITIGLAGNDSSFFYRLCEELHSSDPDSFSNMIHKATSKILLNIKDCDSVMEGAAALTTVNAFCALCQTHKKAAMAFVKHPEFLLPSPSSSDANTQITPPQAQPPADASTQQRRLFQLLQALNGGRNVSYIKRSGPGIEKHTILGQMMRVGLPTEHQTVVGPFQQAVTKTTRQISQSTDQMRNSHKQYRDAIHILFKALLKAGAKEDLLSWISDALMLNTGATALRPDRAKVSHAQFLMNLSYELMKLSEPFVNDDKKLKLIDPGFLDSQSGADVFAKKDEVPRLAEEQSGAQDSVEYNPKNTFIPQLFFFTSRALHLGVFPRTSHHLGILQRVYMLRQRAANPAALTDDPEFNHMLSLKYANEASVLSNDLLEDSLNFYCLVAKFLLNLPPQKLQQMPEHMVDDMCELFQFVSKVAPKVFSKAGMNFGSIFQITVKLLSPEHAHTVRNYNLRAKLGDVLYEVFLPTDEDGSRGSLPSNVGCDATGSPYLISDTSAQETLAPSLLLLYGEVEHTGYYEKMGYRARIASLLKYLWGSKEHRPAFRRITKNKESFIKFANGIMNETNSLIASVMEKLPEIKQAQELMSNPTEWSALSEEQRETISSRREDNEQEVKGKLPLCNKTLQMLGFLNTDPDIRALFLLEEMCPRLVNMLFHVLTKLIGSRGLELRVENPEQYNFRPKEMLRDLCSIFASFASAKQFQVESAKSGYYNQNLLEKSVTTCRRLNLLKGASLDQFASLTTSVEQAASDVLNEEALFEDAPAEFMDPLLCTFMKDPVYLPTSGTIIDRSTITQHLLNDSQDPFNRKELTLDMIQPATELKQKMMEWLKEKERQSTT